MMTLFKKPSTAPKDPPVDKSFAELLRQLHDGWHVEPPVYAMKDPMQRARSVFRLVLWRDGRPHVLTVCDGADIRQFIAERGLQQESL